MENCRFRLRYPLWHSRNTSGKHGWTTDPDTTKRSIDRQLAARKTDYIDFGFLDEESDLKQTIERGVPDYIQSLKDCLRFGTLPKFMVRR